MIALKNLTKSKVIIQLSKARNKLEPLLLDDERNQKIAKKIEADIRTSVRLENSNWQLNFERKFIDVSSSYQTKLHFEDVLHSLKINIQRLNNKIAAYNNDIQEQKKNITNAKLLKKQIVKESLSTLQNIPFYVVIINSVDFNNNNTTKEAEKAIWNYVRPNIIEHINGAFIKSETQVVDNKLFKDSIEKTVIGRISVEGTNNRPFVEAISGNVNKVTLSGLVAVYPWQNKGSSQAINQV